MLVYIVLHSRKYSFSVSISNYSSPTPVFSARVLVISPPACSTNTLFGVCLVISPPACSTNNLSTLFGVCLLCILSSVLSLSLHAQQKPWAHCLECVCYVYCPQCYLKTSIAMWQLCYTHHRHCITNSTTHCSAPQHSPAHCTNRANGNTVKAQTWSLGKQPQLRLIKSSKYINAGPGVAICIWA